VGGAPLEVCELVIDGATDDLGVTVLELLVELAKGCDLGGADEGEVLGVEEEYKPLPTEGVIGNLLKVILRLLGVDVVQVATLKCGELKLGELISNSQKCHVRLSLETRTVECRFCLRNPLYTHS